MAQGRQQNNGSRQRCAQSAAAKASAEPPKAVCAQLEQLNRKLAAASAEILRYQTRLFACERQMAALRQENAQLEAACAGCGTYAPAAGTSRLPRARGRSRRPNSPRSLSRRPHSLLSRTGSPRPDWSTSRWS